MKNILLLLLLFMAQQGYGQLTTEEQTEIVNQFKNWVATDNLDSIAANTSFPLNREYPLPDLKNEKEFRAIYPNIFNAELKKIIKNSDAEGDWTVMGSEGIMLDRGTVWLDYEGALIGVNYQSPIEKQEREKLIEAERLDVHTSLRVFKNPILIMRTSRFIVRIDELENGQYRYASWRAGKNQSEKPDLTLSNGEMKFQGSGGNHSYEFSSGRYKYICDIISLGSIESPPGRLLVLKDNYKFLAQDVILLKD